MKLLRETIRKLILEETSEDEFAEFRRWYKPNESTQAIKELAGMFEDSYSFRAGPAFTSFDIYEMKYVPEPECVVRFRLYSMHGMIKFDEIETSPQCEGRGYARQVIKMVQDVARKYGVKIYLRAKAFHTHKGEGRMSTADLERWYASQGFIKNGKDMEWKP